MPTPSPGCHLVPRWRMMMLPAITCWPPNFFTPRRRPAESRPLRDEPPAFLCAISNYLLLLLSGLLRHRLLCSGLLGRGFLLRSSRLRRLGFLGLGLLGRRLRLGLCLRSFGGLRGLFDLRSGFLRQRGLLLGLLVADRDDAQQRHLLAVPGLA